MSDLLKGGAKVVNIGIEQFYDDLKTQGSETVNMDWKPSVADSSLLSKLKKLKK